MIDFLFWVVIALLVLSPILGVLYIGKPRDPITPGSAVAGLILNGLIIFIIVARVVEAQQ